MYRPELAVAVKEGKTREQLEREIAYYRWYLERSRDVERRARAEASIRKREKQLARMVSR